MNEFVFCLSGFYKTYCIYCLVQCPTATTFCSKLSLPDTTKTKKTSLECGTSYLTATSCQKTRTTMNSSTWTEPISSSRRTESQDQAQPHGRHDQGVDGSRTGQCLIHSPVGGRERPVEEDRQRQEPEAQFPKE